MKISRRIFLYSLGIVSVVAILIISYFTLMLSPLYANQIETERINSLKKIQKSQLTNSEEKINNALNNFDTPNSVVALKFSKMESLIGISFVYKTYDIEVKDPELKDFYQEVIRVMDTVENQSIKENKTKFNEIIQRGKELFITKGFKLNLDDSIIAVEEKDPGTTLKSMMDVTQKTSIHRTNDQQYLMEMKATDQTNIYVTYVGVTRNKETNYLLVATTMTPKMNALQKVIYQSLPTLIAVMTVLIIMATLMFSKILITPLQNLSLKMKGMKQAGFELETVDKKDSSKDEYQQVEDDLRALYKELALQKKMLESQNQKQKIFLSASSHQLKTPITAALLLIDSMVEEIGKYRDTKKYLPELKIKLQDMQQIINEILLIDQQTKREVEYQELNFSEVIQPLIEGKRELLESKKIEVIDQLPKNIIIKTDYAYLEKIIDNLLINGIKYTNEYEKIIIRGNNRQVQIENTGVQIPEEYLSKLFEPFVRPSQSIQGHGLGLYLIAQYAAIIDLKVELLNNPKTNSVIAVINFE